MSTDLPDPLVPADVDLTDFAFMPLEVQRLRNSELASDETPESCWAAMLLWCAAWHEVPAVATIISPPLGKNCYDESRSSGHHDLAPPTDFCLSEPERRRHDHRDGSVRGQRTGRDAGGFVSHRVRRGGCPGPDVLRGKVEEICSRPPSRGRG